MMLANKVALDRVQLAMLHTTADYFHILQYLSKKRWETE